MAFHLRSAADRCLMRQSRTMPRSCLRLGEFRRPDARGAISLKTLPMRMKRIRRWRDAMVAFVCVCAAGCLALDGGELPSAPACLCFSQYARGPL